MDKVIFCPERNSNSTSIFKNLRSELIFLMIQALLWNGAYLCTLLAGTNTHSIDFRKSAGGFIHGFRYTGIKIKRNYEKDVVLFMFYKICL